MESSIIQVPRQSGRKRKPIKDIQPPQPRKKRNVKAVNSYEKLLKSEILKEYNSVKKLYDRKVMSIGYDGFFNIEIPLQKEEETIALPKFQKHLPNNKDKRKIVKFDESNKNGEQKLSTILLKKSAPIPTMTQWIPITKNFYGKEQHILNNWPYLGESLTADAEVRKQIAKLFPDGVHGSDLGCKKYINDFILFNVSAPILKRHQWESIEEIERFMIEMRKLFPIKGSVKQFIQSYMASMKRCGKKDKIEIIELDDEKLADSVEQNTENETIADFKDSEPVENVEWTGKEKSYYNMFLISGKNYKCPPQLNFKSNDRKLQNVTVEQRNDFRRNCQSNFNNSLPYEPCKHSGACTIENGCSCKKRNTICNKFCQCPSTCRSKFPGCKCAPGMCATVKCDCFLASWECDPDLCQSCNCDGKDGKPLCKNVNIQRSLNKKLFLQLSRIAGTGCFVDEFVRKNGYIGEYTGEIISDDEAERRGIIYDAGKCSYLFDINEEQSIDATRYGSLLRFVNHSDNPNCYPRILIVNGEHKIGFFALRNIKAGEELFFDYHYDKVLKQKYNFKNLA